MFPDLLSTKCTTCAADYACQRRQFCFCELADLDTSIPSFEPIQCLADLPAGFVEKYWEAKQIYIRMQHLLRDPVPPKRTEATADEELIDAMVDRTIELHFFDWFYANFAPFLRTYPLKPAYPPSPLQCFSDLSCLDNLDCSSSDTESEADVQIRKELEQLTNSMAEFGVPLEPFQEFDKHCQMFNDAALALHTLLPVEKINIALPPPGPELDLDLSFLDDLQ